MSRKRIGRRSICSVRRLTAERCARSVAAAGIGRVNRLPDIRSRVIPFFVRFPLVGTKAHDFELFAEAAELLGKRVMSDADYTKYLTTLAGIPSSDPARQRKALTALGEDPCATTTHPFKTDRLVRSASEGAVTTP